MKFLEWEYKLPVFMLLFTIIFSYLIAELLYALNVESRNPILFGAGIAFIIQGIMGMIDTIIKLKKQRLYEEEDYDWKEYCMNCGGKFTLWDKLTFNIASNKLTKNVIGKYHKRGDYFPEGTK